MDRVLGYILSNIISYSIFVYYFDIFSERKDLGKKFYIYTGSIVGLNILGNAILNPGLGFFLLKLACILLVINLYKGRLGEKIANLIMIIFIIISSEFITMFALKYLSLDKLGFIPQVLISSLTYLILILLMIKLRKDIAGTNPLGLFFFVLTLIILIISIANQHIEGKLFQDQYLSYLLFVLVFIGFVFILLKSNYENQVNKLRLRTLAKEIEDKGDYYKEIALKEKEIRRIKHDLKNKLSSILVSGKDLDLEVYKIIGDLDYHGGLYSANPIINYILTSKLKRLAIGEERLKISIDVAEDLPISPGDLGLVLRNALDNAIEALDYLAYEERYLKIGIDHDLGVLHIGIENSYDKDQVKPGKYRGFGLESIKEICQAYHSFVEIERDKTFQIYIFMLDKF